jgi:carboxymethylenebutenolidase
MDRKRATDFPPEVIDLFNRYVHGEIGRSAFLDRAAKFAFGGLSAAGMFAALKPNYAWATQVAPNDPRIRTEYATVSSPQGFGSIRGYLARPAGASTKAPAVIVIHENRGLNPYIEDVARRLATVNYVAFAPDGLTSVGGFQGDEEKAAQQFAALDKTKMTEDFVASANWLKARPETTGKLGVVGFCFGGSICNTFAVRMPDLAASVPFYGGPPAAGDVPKIKAAVLSHTAGLDERLMAAQPAYDAAMTSNNVRHSSYVYQGAYHGFHNDTTPRYDEAAAKLAWQRTVDWFSTYLRA